MGSFAEFILSEVEGLRMTAKDQNDISADMTRILNYFLRGLVVVTPLAVTIWVCVTIFETIDSWLGLPVRGAGFVITLVLITLIGFLASSILARTIGGEFDK